jgi:hypothetical protein
MIELALTGEQATAVRDADALVPVLDPDGNLIGHIVPLVDRERARLAWTDEELREAKKRTQSQGPWHTTQEVMARLLDLEAKQ